MRYRSLLILLFLSSLASATPDGPRYYYLGPKIDPGGDIDWAWPPGAMAGIDLSGATNNIAFYWSDHPISAPGAIYGGTDLARTMGAGAKAVWAASTEVDVPAGSWTLLDLLWGSLNGWENVSGLNPIVPTSEGFLELWMPGHSLVRKEKWQGEFSGSYNRVRRLVRQSIKRAYLHGLDELQTLDGITLKALKELRDGVGDNPDEQKYIDAARRLIQNQGLTPAEAKAKIQDYIAKKYRQFLATQVAKLNLDWRDLVDAGVPMLGPVKPSTSYTDDFDDGVLDGWTTLDGTWSIYLSDDLYNTGGGTDHCGIKFDSALSSDDQIVQIVQTYASTTTRWMGPLTRQHASAETHYVAFTDRANGTYLFRTSSGSSTLVYNTTSKHAPFVLVELKSDGSSHTVTVNGSEEFSVTDTNITGNLYTGVGSTASGNQRGDLFSCEDIVASGPAIPVFLNQYRRRWQ